MSSLPADSGIPAPLELEATPPDVKHYQQLKRLAGLGSLALTLLWLLLMCLVAVHVDQALRHGVGDNRWLRLIGLGIIYAASLELLTLPLDFWSGFILEHRFQLSNLPLWGWIWRQIKGYLVGGPLGLLFLLGLYSLMWFSGPWWWLWTALAWLVVTLVLGQLLPVVILPLFYKVTRLEDSALLGRLQRLTAGTGLKVEGIYRLDLSAETRKANAALAGMGRTRRVLLGDTLLEEFTPEEIEVVFAHEVGHHVHRHLPKLVLWSAVLATLAFWLANVVLRSVAEGLHYPGSDGIPAFQDPATLPLLLLGLTLFSLVIAPMQNALSRFFERQCDDYALEKTGLLQAYRSAFIKLARMNKVDPDPHPVVVWLFDDHPPIRQRLARADRVAPPRP
jgi:STE24 endopeptidase